MANRRLVRPVHPLPSWANDALINDPGEPWHNTDTKVQPGAGKRDDGGLPEESPAAQHINQLFNELGQWVQYLSDVQPMNWKSWDTPYAAAGGATSCVVWDEGAEAWLCGGRADTCALAQIETEWSDVGAAVAVSDFTWGASKNPGDTPGHIGSNSIFGDGGTLRAASLIRKS